MGSLMRAHDWSTSPLGSPDDWPASLRTVVSLLLNSKFPMFVAGGPALGFLYNDPYAEILGDKHPGALGLSFRDISAEIWKDMNPLLERALAGEATYSENLPFTLLRNGYAEKKWFTFSYSPVCDESGMVAGLYCCCTETTAQVLAARKGKQEHERLRQLFEQAQELWQSCESPLIFLSLLIPHTLNWWGTAQLSAKPYGRRCRKSKARDTLNCWIGSIKRESRSWDAGSQSNCSAQVEN